MSVDVISPETSLELREATLRYERTVAVPFYAEAGSFVLSHAGIDTTDIVTLITGGADNLAISFGKHEETFGWMINIDLYPEGPANIVRPNFYMPDGTQNSKLGEFMRKVVRPISELEGVALISDINHIVSITPPDRRR